MRRTTGGIAALAAACMSFGAAAPAQAGVYTVFACNTAGRQWDNRSWELVAPVGGIAADQVCTDDARFGFAERRWGVPLIDGGTQRLPRIVGQGRALDLVLSGRTIDAAEAHAIGLVTEVVRAGAHVARALKMAEGLAAFPQDTMLSDRRALLEGSGLPLADGLALEAKLGREVLATAVEGAGRFAGGEGRSGAGTGV